MKEKKRPSTTILLDSKCSTVHRSGEGVWGAAPIHRKYYSQTQNIGDWVCGGMVGKNGKTSGKYNSFLGQGISLPAP